MILGVHWLSELMTLDLALTNCIIVTPRGRIGPDVTVGISEGTITSISIGEQPPSAERTLDLNENYIVPGLIDCHVHTRSPGAEYKEDWETATKAAAAGGVTSLLAMPNTDPMIDRPSHVEQVFKIADNNALIDFQSYAVLTSENYDQVPQLVDAGIVGFKVFLGTTFGDIQPPNDGELHEAMLVISETGRRVGFHEENDEIISHYTKQRKEKGQNHPLDHARSRPVIAEKEAVSRMALLAEDTDCPVHMFHVSSGSAAKTVAEAKSRGVNITAETTPHYLWFTQEILEEKGNIAKIQPPIRTVEEQNDLWTCGINGAGIDCIGTDHAPHTDTEKSVDAPFGNTWEVNAGFVGLETAAPSLLTFVDEGRLSLEQWVYLHSVRPAEIWGLYPQKGTLRVGTDADFTVIDLNQTWTLDRKSLHSKSTTTPFDGETFVGEITKTIVRGNVVYDGEICGDPGTGKRISVNETGAAGGSPYQ